MKTLVISAVNFTEGGPLTVLRDAVRAARECLPDWRIMVMAHDASLIETLGIDVRGFAQTKTSWVRRILLEWWQFERVSRELRVDLWLSLHDITPRVLARRQAVYCHNPAPFANPTLADCWFEPRFLAFSAFYSWVYRPFIHRNHTVVVQQTWLKEQFKKRYSAKNVVVAQPQEPEDVHPPGRDLDTVATFLYPALPRCFKNFEVIGRAVEQLEQGSEWSGTVRWTISGDENRYARWLRKRFGHLKTIQWIGRRSTQEMSEEYSSADALIFPSRLETWGLPLTEAKRAGMALLAADLPYARETVGPYDHALFFPASDDAMLAHHMLSLQKRGTACVKPRMVRTFAPSACSWQELIHLLVEGL